VARTSPAKDISTLLTVVTAVVVISALYFARVILVPLALAVLFTFLLTPLAGALERIHFPRFLAIFLVVGIAIAAFGGVGWTVGNQVLDVTNQLPSYKSNIRTKIDSLRNPRNRKLDNAADAVKEIGKEITDASSYTVENATGKGKRAAAIPPPSCCPAPSRSFSFTSSCPQVNPRRPA